VFENGKCRTHSKPAEPAAAKAVVIRKAVKIGSPSGSKTFAKMDKIRQKEQVKKAKEREKEREKQQKEQAKRAKDREKEREKQQKEQAKKAKDREKEKEKQQKEQVKRVKEREKEKEKRLKEAKKEKEKQEKQAVKHEEKEYSKTRGDKKKSIFGSISGKFTALARATSSTGHHAPTLGATEEVSEAMAKWGQSCSYEGFLLKLTHSTFQFQQRWQSRWCRLSEGKLHYYHHRPIRPEKAKKSVELRGYAPLLIGKHSIVLFVCFSVNLFHQNFAPQRILDCSECLGNRGSSVCFNSHMRANESTCPPQRIYSMILFCLKRSFV